MVAVSANHVGSTSTLTTAGVADAADGTLRVAVASHCAFVQKSRDAEDVLIANFRHRAFDDAPAAFQTSVALERIPRFFTLRPMKHVHLLDLGHQHQRVDERVWILDVAVGGVPRESQTNRVVQSFLQAHWGRQQHMPGSGWERDGLLVSPLGGVAAVSAVTWRVEDGALHPNHHQLPLLRQLWLVANKYVIVHRHWDVIDVELYIPPFWDKCKAHSGPGGSSVLRIGPRNGFHTRSESGLFSFIGVVIQSDEVEAGLYLITPPTRHVLPAHTLS